MYIFIQSKQTTLYNYKSTWEKTKVKEKFGADILLNRCQDSANNWKVLPFCGDLNIKQLQVGFY